MRSADRKVLGWLMLVALVWVGATEVWAQDLRYLSHQAWSTEEGLPQSSVHAIVQGRDGYLWVATEGGLVRFDGVSFRTFGRATDAAFESDDICCLKVDADGSLLAGTASGWLRMRAGRFSRAHGQVPEEGAQPGSVAGMAGRVQAVLVDREGLEWVGTRSGLKVVDRKTGQVQQVTALDGDSVLCLFEDAEGNHWIGTETSGLHVLRRLKFRSEAGLAGLAVTSVAATNDGAMWVGTREDGLRRVKDEVVSEPVPVDKLTSGVILCMAVAGADGRLWVGTPDGLNVIRADGAVWRVTSADGLPDDYVRSIGEQLGNRSAMWVGTQKGMVRIPYDLVEQVLTTRNGLKGDMVGAVLGLPRGVLVATSGGLSMLGRDGTVQPFPQGDVLKGAIVTAMALDKDFKVWLATNDGRLYRMEDAAGLVQVGRFPADNGIDGIVADEQGSLWLRMKRGIRRIQPEKLRACVDNAPCGEPGMQYGVADGLPTDEVVSGETSGGALRNGEIWFPTRRGVAVVDARHLPVDTVAPPVVVERVLVDDAPVSASGEVRVPYGQERLTVEYAGLSFTAPSEVRYRVKLEGFDRDWVDAGAKRSATYTNLAPGSYVFRVQAVNGDGVWNLSGAQIRVRVVPPYWRRWWFVALLLVGLGALLAGVYLLRLRGLRRNFEMVLAERNRMAREIHDTLTQDFVGTSVQLDIVAQMLRRGKVEAALEQVVKTRRLVTEGLDEARRSIWELRSGGAEDGLPLRMRRLVEREEWAEIGAKAKVGGAVRKLEPNVEREVLRVAQEALQNVKRHARATETLVDLHYSDEAVLLTIEDNGVGFRMEDVPSGHYGLMGMKERAKVVEGELLIRSELGKGTAVRLRIGG